MDLLVIFFTGLTTGGLSCLAMQGGLLASVIANQKGLTTKPTNQVFTKSEILPVAMFLGSKLVAHAVLGFFLGLVGSVITLTLGMRLVFQTFAALFMLATAMNLLHVHPIFRHLAFQPPKVLERFIRRTSKSDALFAPGVLGVMTIFVPCGVTQAMEVLAINSGNPLYGSLIMASFVLGTMPLFVFLGVLASKLSSTWSLMFSKVAAVALIGMAVYGINGVLLVIDSPITVNKLVQPVRKLFVADSATSVASPTVVNGVQPVTITIENSGYNPRFFRVQQGTPVELTLQSNNVYSCALSFVFREFGIKAFLQSTDTQKFTFTPNKPGVYTYTCSMGMYSGTMEVL